MVYEEYDKMLTDILSNPDTALANIGAFKDALKEDLTSLESAKVANGDLEKRVRDLQDTNMKLYLSQGGAPIEEEEPEPVTGEAVIDELMGQLFAEPTE